MKKFLIIVAPGLPLSWAADYELQTARSLSKRHLVIIFAFAEGVSARTLLTKHRNPLVALGPNLYVFYPFYLIPFQRLSRVRKINFLLSIVQLKLLILSRRFWRHLPKIFWTFSLQHALLPHHFGSSFLAIYDCVDSFTAESQPLKNSWKIHEKQLMKESHIVFTNNRMLYRRHINAHPSVFLVPVGFNPDMFAGGPPKAEVQKFRGIPHPRVGFVGNINGRIDFSFLRALISKTPSFSYVFIGQEGPSLVFTNRETTFHKNIDLLKKYENVFFLGQIDKSQLAQCYYSLDVGLIPYDTRQEFNQFCFPMKTLEYFAAGLPVVSTAIPSLVPLRPMVTIVRSATEASTAVKKLTSSSRRSGVKKKQRAFANANSWEKKISSMLHILEKEFPDKIKSAV